MTQPKLDVDLAYWTERLRGYEDLDLPTDHVRPRRLSGRTGSVGFDLPSADVPALREACRVRELARLSWLASAVYVLLRRYGGHEHVCLGVAGAEQPSGAPCPHTLVIRVGAASRVELSGGSLLSEVHTAVQEARSRQAIPLQTLLAALAPERTPSRHPVFQVRVDDANAGRASRSAVEASGLDLGFSFFDSEDGGLEGVVEYSLDLYERETVERMAGHLVRVLKGLVSEPGRHVDELELLTAEERRRVVVEWNATGREYACGRSLGELFSEQARRTPSSEAVVYAGERLSYAELDERSGRVAGYLCGLGVGVGELVGLCVERSLELVVGMLGIVKAGAGYVPIDPGYPEERIRFMLEECGVRVLLTQGKLCERARGWVSAGVVVVALDEEWGEIGRIGVMEALSVSERSLAYVIYTSGSTGRPKGVMVEQRGVVRLVLKTNYVQVVEGEGVLQYAPPSFDAATFELWSALLNGGRVCVAPAGRLSLVELSEFVRSERVRVAWLTAPLFQSMVEQCVEFFVPLRVVLAGGDVLSLEAVKKLAGLYAGLEIVNGYGPTENTTFTTCHRVSRGELDGVRSVAIGEPISNTTVYVLDERLEPVPLGVYGELYTGGLGLAWGYLGRPELTAERFIADPFGRGGRLYRTGDVVRWRSDGRLEYWGRRDQQVKVRGFRIELGEIEAALSGYGRVSEAVVVARHGVSGGSELVGYFVPSGSGDGPGAVELREYLRERLPEYMVPGVWVCLERMPLTPNGKVDRKALSQLEVVLESGQEYVAPRSETERRLCAIWEEVLGREGVGIRDDFFELGGHSLLAMRIVSRIQKELGADVGLVKLFEAPRIEELAREVELRGVWLGQAIERVSREGALPLSYAQERMWFLSQLGQGERYHIPLVWRVEGELGVEELRRALVYVVERHEALRTGFVSVDGRALQVIGGVEGLAFDCWDLTGLGVEARECRVRELVDGVVGRGFDLERAPLLRGVVLRLSEREHVVALCLHHIVADGWSMVILVRELSAAYAAYCAGREPGLKELPIQYADYAVWQRGVLTASTLDEELSYWTQRLRGYQDLDLPTDRARPRRLSGRGGRERVKLSGVEVAQLREVCQARRMTLYPLLLASVYVLLRRYSGQEDICLGMPVANRTHWAVEDLIGFFVNTLVIRVGAGDSSEMRCGGLLDAVHAAVLEAQSRQSVPFEKVVEALQPKRDVSRNPVFQVVVNYVNTGNEELSLGVSRSRAEGYEYEVSKFDLGFSFFDSEDGGLEGVVEYSLDLYERETVERMAGHLVRVLKGLVSEPGRHVDELELLTAEERRRVVVEWNATGREYACGRSLGELFSEQARRTPSSEAVVYAGERLSYAELDERSGRVAGYLCGLGVGVGELVGLCVERSLELVVGMLGIVKAGAGYVPIDPGYPEERIRFMLEECGVRVLLTQGKLCERARGWVSAGVVVVALDEEWGEIGRIGVMEALSVSERSLAYVIYTSGSTGRPKGVMVEQRGVVNLCAALEEAVHSQSSRPGRRATLNAPVIFDASVKQLVLLLRGYGLYIVPEEVRHDGRRLLEFVRENDLDVVDCTPAHLELLVLEGLLDEAGIGASFLVGGDALHAGLWQRLSRAGSARFYNVYGPTECTVDATVACIGEDLPQPVIGRALGNNRVYVLGRGMEPVPVGAVGELYIGGAGVARGYLKRAELTAEKFVCDPFGESGGRLYRTGDRVRWRLDGTIEFLGRVDHQVKIRGHRIELGAVEAALREQVGVREAAVLAPVGLDGTKYLVGFVVMEEGAGPVSELTRRLRANVPEAMVPSAIVCLERMPLTPNGKVDRKALSQLEVVLESGQEYVAPRSETERRLCAIWEEVLGREGVGIRDDFFELGGHSLLAMRIVSRIQKELGADVGLVKLFEAPRIEELAREVELRGVWLGQAIERVSREGALPLSYAQERMWFLSQLGQGERYHIPLVWRVEGELGVEELRRALVYVVERHEALRTGFVSVDGRALQVIGGVEGLAFDCWDLTGLGVEARECRVRELVDGVVGRGFDLERAPLLRGVVLRLSEREHVVALCLHHIVADGWSMVILVRELSAAYAAYCAGREPGLKELPIQYADYAVWQRKTLGDARLEAELAYWTELLRGYEDLNLPGDHARPRQLSGRGGRVRFALPPGEARRLRQACQARRMTLYPLLLASVYALLRRYSGQDDICLGMPVANRGHWAVEDLIGLFVNTLVIRVDPACLGDASGSALLRLVEQRVRQAQARQSVPFEKVVEALRVKRDLSRNPVFQVLVNYVSDGPKRGEWEGVSVRAEGYEYEVSKFDLGFSFFDSEDGGLEGVVEYSLDLYERETVERMAGHLVRVLKGLVSEPGRHVDELELLTAEERRRVVVEWNATGREYACGRSLGELFSEQARRTPSSEAVVYAGERLSYAELDERSGRVAGYLCGLGVGVGELVGLCVERSLELVVGMLGIVKAGAGYVPIDPGYPEERIRFMLEECGVRVLLTQGKLCERARGWVSAGVVVVALDEEWGEIGRIGVMEALSVSERSLAYVIYTSGSTGRPKGVMVEQRGVVNLCAALEEAVHSQSSRPGRRATLNAPVIFDASVKQLVLLLRGYGLYIVPEEVRHDGRRLLEFVRENDLDVVDCTPAHLELLVLEGLLDEAGIGASFLVGGDALHAGLWQRLSRAGSARFYNVYGPTECTVDATVACIGEDLPQPVIGRALGNNRVYVLGRGMEPVPVGAVGELYIGGAGVARGYLKRAELTAEKFVCDPFGESGGRLYRTGDRVRWRLDGTIEFLGRVDHQVKIRGHRIELGAVEAALREQVGVREAAVLAPVGLDGTKYLVGFVVMEEGAGPVSELTRRLRVNVPEAMVPSAIVCLERMPLTPNGKVDRKALSQLEVVLESGQEYVAPRSETERRLCAIWEEVLGRERVGIDDNFFELGGHSLLALRINARINRELMVTISLREFFESATIAGLAACIQDAEPVERGEL